MDPIVEIKKVKKYYPVEHKKKLFTPPPLLKAVDGISLAIEPGETVSLVGESGCGKSTLARQIMRMEEVTEGEIWFEGENVTHYGANQLKKYWQNIQMIFQDPYSSLNPRWKVRDIVAEPLRRQTEMTYSEREERVVKLLEEVGLSEEYLNRYPHQFSGGQRQRIGVARALALEPKVLVCDEPVSALDVSIQSQVLNLFMDLQEKEEGLAYIFITHDLSVVEHISDRVAVMYLGRIVEQAPRDQLFSAPRHPYTQALLSAIPRIGSEEKREEIILKGDIPNPTNPPSGCTFRTRCPYVRDECDEVEMKLEKVGEDHLTACPFYGEIFS